MTKSLQIVRTLSALRAALAPHRRAGRRIGFVPTMGALHDGHISLVQRAQQVCEVCVVSIFVNPTQFAPGEDLDTYPRSEAEDVSRLSAVGCDLVYLPEVEDIYPQGSVTQVRVEGLSDLLDGRFRPHFFYGVTTVVARLFVHVEPDLAVFGEKDFQQLQIIRRMTYDLGFGIEIIGAPTWRDADGLAQSSRNAYLDPAERRCAGVINRSLHRAARRLAIGRSVAEVSDEMQATLRQAGINKIDYAAVVDPDTLKGRPDEPLKPGDPARVLIAAWLGGTRLIDNMDGSRPA